mmetsp:Transcript_78691/g.234529  ORF Transcript_78691/g.234529 Transcript_78691/m.234529 type:complete len:296 (-) Transcript_78691:583-1470(-)
MEALVEIAEQVQPDHHYQEVQKSHGWDGHERLHAVEEEGRPPLHTRRDQEVPVALLGVSQGEHNGRVGGETRHRKVQRVEGGGLPHLRARKTSSHEGPGRRDQPSEPRMGGPLQGVHGRRLRNGHHEADGTGGHGCGGGRHASGDKAGGGRGPPRNRQVHRGGGAGALRRAGAVAGVRGDPAACAVPGLRELLEPRLGAGDREPGVHRQPREAAGTRCVVEPVLHSHVQTRWQELLPGGVWLAGIPHRQQVRRSHWRSEPAGQCAAWDPHVRATSQAELRGPQVPGHLHRIRLPA